MTIYNYINYCIKVIVCMKVMDGTFEEYAWDLVVLSSVVLQRNFHLLYIGGKINITNTAQMHDVALHHIWCCLKIEYENDQQ